MACLQFTLRKIEITMIVTDFLTMSDVERRAILLAKVYEKSRKAAGQLGYRVERDGVINDSVFKQLLAVVTFLKEQNVTVTWTDVNWQGYVEFVFKSLHPHIPQPAQLKNIVLFKRFLKSQPDLKVDALRSEDDMEIIYKKAVRQEIRSSTLLMQLVGVQRI